MKSQCVYFFCTALHLHVTKHVSEHYSNTSKPSFDDERLSPSVSCNESSSVPSIALLVRHAHHLVWKQLPRQRHSSTDGRGSPWVSSSCPSSACYKVHTVNPRTVCSAQRPVAVRECRVTRDNRQVRFAIVQGSLDRSGWIASKQLEDQRAWSPEKRIGV